MCLGGFMCYDTEVYSKWDIFRKKIQLVQTQMMDFQQVFDAYGQGYFPYGGQFHADGKVWKL